MLKLSFHLSAPLRRIGLIVFPSLLMAACAEVKIPITVDRAAEVNLTRYRHIAFENIGGKFGEQFVAVMKERMTAAGRLQVVERDRMDQVMKELKLSHADLVDETHRAKLGKLLPVSALIMGKVDGDYREAMTWQPATCYRRVRVGDRWVAQEYPCTNYYRTGTAKMEALIDVVDVETGRVLKSKRLTASRDGQTSATDGTPVPIDPHPLQEQNLGEIVSRFHTTIMPWKEEVQVPFRKDGAIPALEVGTRQAQVGDMQDAIKTFMTAAKASEGNPKISAESIAAAYWNLGLAYTYAWEFDKAIEAFKKVESLSPGDFDTPGARKDIERLRSERKKLEEQEVGR